MKIDDTLIFLVLFIFQASSFLQVMGGSTFVTSYTSLTGVTGVSGFINFAISNMYILCLDLRYS